MSHRVGTFFILLGVLLIALFLLSDIANAPVCSLFLYGSAFLAAGIFLWFRSPLPAGPPAGRFRLLKGGKKGGKPADKKPGGKP